jgi:archaellum component FlaC
MPQQDKGEDEENGKPRFEESFDDIMARMNKISEEIGEKH